MDDSEDTPYGSPREIGRDRYERGGEEYAPLVMQWGLMVWTLALMGLITVIVLVVEMIPAGN